MSSPWSPMSLEEEEEIQELDAEEQQDGEQPQQGDGLQQGSTAEARAQQTGKKRARSVANSSTKSEAKIKVEESAPGAATGVILSLRESLQDCKQSLASCQVELEAAKSEIEKWHSAFQSIPAVPSGTSPVVSYLSNLKSSEESLKEQLEKAKKREAAFIVTFAKREQEIAELKSAVRDLKTQLRPPSMQTRRLLLDPAIHEEFTRLKNLVEEKEKKIKELQDNVAAVNFTPSSKLGKMLMAKCRTLQEENEEIGAMASEGKEMDL
uniref:FKBP12-interacting protein of 37 kDa n=1 Tax=Zea mays TaxID=4577 RepID=A0A804PFD7_MAIZE